MVLGHRGAAQVAARRAVASAAAGAAAGAGCPRAMRRRRATTSALSAPGGGSRHGASATFTFVPARPSSGTGSSWPSLRAQRAPGARQVEASPAARAGQDLAAQRRVAEAGVAAGARAAIGQQRAVDVGDDQLGAAQRDRAQLAGRDVAGRVERHPRRRRRGRGRRRWASGSAAARATARAACGAATTPSTSRPARSGAASSIASLIASSSVAADAGQPLQWPSSRSRATPSVDAEQLDVAAVRLHVRPHGGERLAHARLEVDRDRGRGSAAGWPRRRPRTSCSWISWPAAPASWRRSDDAPSPSP